ncbi:RNA-directed DNA polymerase from mobile element jockey [Labeo rohita]|uniref:RNA-directed DNA polymerase from mobile element jockey n=1 Tax=Labeo rohita TaxID=84645 RepID=A0ABQ8L495_LABRO|nr:RNA-directed DNA polymerase from mobile element jockey [Labeo rohita]
MTNHGSLQNSDIFVKPKKMLIGMGTKSCINRPMWKGLKDITNYKTPSPSTVENQQLADDLNEFYCRFEKTPLTPPTTLLSLTPALQIREGDMHQVFRKNKRRKAPGPDGVTSACLKTCDDQLAPIFSQIFNRSLELCEVPSCFKRSTIIPVPKKHKITGLNDHRPVALMTSPDPILDPLQFAYRANRSVDDAVNMGLHFILQHLDKSGTYVRILFVDFSLAFNTIIPNLLLPKLIQLSVPTSICQWITSFLTDRQLGCVLSPLLFSLYTNDCTSKDPSVKLLKFADDTTVIGLIQDGDDGDDSRLQEKPPCTHPSHHHGEHCNDSGDIQVPWQHHLSGPEVGHSHRLNCQKGPAEAVLPSPAKFNLPQELLKQFYTAIIESVLCTSITVWFSSATKSNLRRLHWTVQTAERIIGTTLPTLQELYLSRVSKKAGKITLDPSHPAHSLFELLPSGRCYRALSTRMARHRNSFFPQAIHLMNTSQ